VPSSAKFKQTLAENNTEISPKTLNFSTGHSLQQNGNYSVQAIINLFHLDKTTSASILPPIWHGDALVAGQRHGILSESNTNLPVMMAPVPRDKATGQTSPLPLATVAYASFSTLTRIIYL
jgi:hypothetical protein